MSVPLSLERLVAAVEDELQEAPAVRRWNTRVRRVINDVYLAMWQTRDWPWKQRDAPLWVYPDVPIPRTELVKFNNTNVLRVFDFANVRTTLGGLLFPAEDVIPSGPTGPIQNHMEALVGAEIGLETPSTTDLQNGNWREGPFVVDRVYWSTTSNPNGPVFPNLRLWLDQRCEIRSLAAEDGEAPLWLRFPRYQLPYDVDQLIDVRDENGLPLPFLDAEQHAWLKQGTGRPPAGGPGYTRGWAWDRGVEITAPLHLTASPNMYARSEQPVAFDHDENLPVREEIVAELVNAASTLTVGRRYRFAVCWHYRGRFGPLSNVVEATPTNATRTVQLQNLPELPANATLLPAVDYGFTVAIFMAEEDEAFYLLQHLDPPPSPGGTSRAINIAAPLETSGRPWKRIRYDQLHPTVYQSIRLYPRPTGFKQYQLRYWMRPTPLVNEEDTPRFHHAFHMVLVYGAAAALVANRTEESSRSALYTRLTTLFNQKLAEMQAYYFPGQHRMVRKGGVLDPNAATYWPLTSVDWNGDQ